MTAQVASLELTEAAKWSGSLRALPDSYHLIRSEWLTNVKFAKDEADKTFDALSQLFNVHTLQISRKKEAVTPAVMFAGRQGKRDDTKVCWNCGKTGHLSTKCAKPKIGDSRSHPPKTRTSATA